MEGPNNKQGNNPEGGKGGSEKLNDGERAKIATALRLGQVASKAAELSADENIYSSDEAKAIEEEGDVSLIVAEADKQDMSNAVKEAVEKKVSKEKNILYRTLLKPIMTAHYAAVASKAVEKAGGDASAAFAELGLDDTSRINKDSTEYIKRKARLVLEKDGFSNDKIDSESSFHLEEGEKVEKVQDEKAKEVNETLKDLFKELEDAKKQKDDEAYKKAWNDYNEKIEQWQEKGTFGNNQETALDKLSSIKMFRFLFGNKLNNKSVTELSALKKAGEGVKALVEHDTSLNSDKFAEYIDEGHISLYNADIKAGLNKKQLVNNVTAAALAGGAVGAVFYSLVGQKARMGVKGAVAGHVASEAAADVLASTVTGAATADVLASTITGAATGGVAGFAAGAIRGVQHARVKMSESEIEHATSTDEKDVLLTAKEKAEAAKAKAEAEAAKAAEGGNADDKEPDGENAGDNKGADDEKADGKTEAINANKAKKIASIFGKVAEIKKKITSEEKVLSEIEKVRDRKSAKELYENIDRDAIIVKLFNEKDTEARRKLIKELNQSDPEMLNEAVQKLITDERLYTVNKRGKKSNKHLKKHGEIDGNKGVELVVRLLDNKENLKFVESDLRNDLAEVKARNTVSARMKIDLVKYSAGNTAREKYLLR